MAARRPGGRCRASETERETCYRRRLNRPVEHEPWLYYAIDLYTRIFRFAAGIALTDHSADQGAVTPPGSANTDHLVVLVHGINTRGLWMDEVKPALEKSGFTVAPTSYGPFSVLRFLAPFRWLRSRAIERVAADIRTAIRSYKMDNGDYPKKMSVISHSFGTYVVGTLLTNYPEFQWYRIIFWGSVVREDFPLDQVLGRFANPLLNEIGTKDILPALAESAGWGYGSVGSTGFNRPPVETRWHHAFRHSDFLTDDFCRTFWIPFLEGRKPTPGDKPERMPLYVRLICMLPLRWAGVAFVVGVAFWAVQAFTPIGILLSEKFGAARGRSLVPTRHICPSEF